MSEQRCGTCKWYELNPQGESFDLPEFGWCQYNDLPGEILRRLPISYGAHPTEHTDGKDCPTWRAR